MTPKSPVSADRDVGSRIRAHREANGVSQERLAAAVGVTFQQIQKYEKGSNRVSVGRLLAIATALGVAVNELMPPSDAVAAGNLSGPSLFDDFLGTPKAADVMRRWVKLPSHLRKSVLALIDAMADQND